MISHTHGAPYMRLWPQSELWAWCLLECASYCCKNWLERLLTLQVNRVCIWRYSSEVSPGDPDSSPSLMEPEFLCEQEMAADTTDLRFLDEERIVGSFSNGCVSLFRYSAAMQVDVFVQDLAKNYPPSFLTCPFFSLLSHFLCLCVHWVATHFIQVLNATHCPL